MINRQALVKGGSREARQTVEEASVNEQSESYYVFSGQDLDRVDDLGRSIVYSPIHFLLSSSLLVLSAKKLHLRRMLANPFKDHAQIAQSDRLWKFATYNLVGVGTVGCLVGAFLRSEGNKLKLYYQYQDQVNEFMKWRTHLETRQFVNRTAFPI